MTNHAHLSGHATVPTLAHPTLAAPTLKRGGPALLILGIGAFLASLPGLIRGISGMLFALLNPDTTPDTLLIESFGIALVPLVVLTIGLVLVAFGSSKVTANEHARREAEIAELLAEQHQRWLARH